MSSPDRLATVALILFALTRMTWGLPNCPPGGTFYDKHTNRRECCSEICEYREIKMSEDMCRSKCPGYDSQIAAGLMGDGAEQKTARASAKPESYTPVVIGVSVAAAVVLVAAVGGAAIWLQKKRRETAGEPGDGQGRRVDKPLLQNALGNGEGEANCRAPIQVEDPENI